MVDLKEYVNHQLELIYRLNHLDHQDLFQKEHAILRNFPLLGHLRYLAEIIGPEIRQYWVTNDKEEMPFNRAERSWIYATAKKQKNTF